MWIKSKAEQILSLKELNEADNMCINNLIQGDKKGHFREEDLATKENGKVLLQKVGFELSLKGRQGPQEVKVKMRVILGMGNIQFKSTEDVDKW